MKTGHNPNFVVRFFTRDILRKLIALFFAVLLYFVISSRTGEDSRITNVPVELELPPGLMLMDSRAPTVTLHLRGNKNLLNSLSPADLRGRAVLSAANYTPDTAYILRLTPGNFRARLGVAVTSIEPSELMLNIEELETRKVPIEPRYDSLAKLSRDYAVTEVRFTPAEVQISGPKSTVAGTKFIATAPIPLDASSTYSFDYPVGLIAPLKLKVSPEKTVAAITIKRSRIERNFPSVPLSVLNVPGAAGKRGVEFLTAPNIEVKLSGPQGALNDFRPSHIHAYCDISGLKEAGTYTVDVGCYLEHGEGMELVSVYPDKVKVKISKE